MKKSGIVSLGLFGVMLCLGLEAQERKAGPTVGGISLESAINTALKHNPNIHAAEQEIEGSKAGIMRAKSTLYPRVTGNARVFYDNEDVFRQRETLDRSLQGFRGDWIVTLGIEQTIFNGQINRNRIAVSKLENDIQFIRLQEVMNNVIFDVRKAYYDVLLSQSEIESARQNVQLLRKELKRQQELFKAGRSTRFNLLRTEVRLANELPGLSRSQQNYRVSLLTLFEQMGVGWPDQGGKQPAMVVGKLDCPPVRAKINDVITQALIRSPELSRTEKEIEIARREVNIAKGGLWPEITIYGAGNIRHDKDASDSSYASNFTEAAVGFAGRWNIFDGFAGKGRKLEAESKAKAGEIRKSAIARRIESDVRRAFLAIKEAGNAVDSQVDNVKKARQAIDLAQKAVDAGVATQFEVLEANVDHSRAKTVSLRSRYEYHLALALLEKALYTRLETIGDLRVRSEVVGPKAPVRETP